MVMKVGLKTLCLWVVLASVCAYVRRMFVQPGQRYLPTSLLLTPGVCIKSPTC